MFGGRGLLWRRSPRADCADAEAPSLACASTSPDADTISLTCARTPPIVPQLQPQPVATRSFCPAVFMTGTEIPVKLGRSGGVGTITRTDICNLPCPLPILLNHRRPHRDTQRTRIGRHAVAFAAGCTILWRPGVAASTPCAKA